jgi:cobalt-zinc-cadmium efflux system membrane fusion protein
MFVLGDLVTREYRAQVAVKQSGIQTVKKQPVVFVKHQDTYEIRPLELGLAEGEWIEVVNGLSVGDEYVSENAFLIKADALKSGAEHEH